MPLDRVCWTYDVILLSREVEIKYSHHLQWLENFFVFFLYDKPSRRVEAVKTCPETHIVKKCVSNSVVLETTSEEYKQLWLKFLVYFYLSIWHSIKGIHQWLDRSSLLADYLGQQQFFIQKIFWDHLSFIGLFIKIRSTCFQPLKN